MTQDPERAFQPFKHFELRGWRDVAERYDTAFGGATGQAIATMLDAARIGPGVRVLDVACGPGNVAAAAAAQGASVLGLDFAAEMVALAGRKWPGVEFRASDAEHLDLPDATFDAVVMNFGILHLADPDRALAEAWRVLRPGGRLAFTVWEPPPLLPPVPSPPQTSPLLLTPPRGSCRLTPKSWYPRIRMPSMLKSASEVSTVGASCPFRNAISMTGRSLGSARRYHALAELPV